MTYTPPSIARWVAAAEKIAGRDVGEGVGKQIKGVIDGTIRARTMPWPQLTRLARALVPGCIAVLCGDPGSTKSLMSLQLFWHLHRGGERVALFMLECNTDFHGSRLLAQLSGESNMTNSDWIAANPDRAQVLHDHHSASVTDFGYRLWDSPNDLVSHAQLLAWMDEQGRAGVKVFGIDPITAAAPTREPWIADTTFVTSARKILDKYGAMLWCVTHPRKGVKGSGGWDDLAGGAAWARFTDSVIWLDRTEKVETVSVTTTFGHTTAQINRVARVCKARNGIGSGLKVGLWFDARSLTFEERGVIEEGE